MNSRPRIMDCMSKRRKSTRREFLKGKAAAGAFEDLLDRQVPTPSAAVSGEGGGPRRRSVLLQVTRRAMACDFNVFLNAGQDENAAEAAVEALDLVEKLEDQMTVYREHSEISRLNRTAADRDVVVERRLLELLAHAIELCDATGGAFDMTAGPLSKVWGFYRRQGTMPDEVELAEALRRVGSRWIEIDQQKQTVRFRQAGVEINLGGIGKGYALDRCAELMQQRGVESFLIHGGHSSVLARGSRDSGDDETAGWTVGVRHPLRPERRLAEVRLRDRALGTSGSGTQSFRHQGRRYGHILDPRTGQPAEGVLSATVIAQRAATADALATACYVMGADRAIDFCRARADLAAIVVTRGQRSGTIEVHSTGLADDEWTLVDRK